MAHELLKDRVAVITGAGQGLGLAVAREFAEEGAAVVLVELNPATTAAAHKELADKGHRVLSYALDITDHEAYRRAMAEVAAQWGHIDILVNNAAISRYGTILEDNLEDWRKTIAVNLEAVYTCTKATVPYMIQQNWGRIINVSSVQGYASSGTIGAYNASKGGMIAFTRSLAVELAPYNILCNVAAPGYMQTPMSLINGVYEADMPDFKEFYVGKRRIPLARTGYPEEVSGTIVFLASEYCRYMTGQVLTVDGGMLITY